MRKILLLIICTTFSLFMIGCDQDISKVIEENIYSFDIDNSLYTICFKDIDGTILKQEIIRHNSEIVLPDDPIHQDTAKYYYTFIGWDYNSDNEVDTIPSHATYSFIAVAVYQYILRDYNVQFVVNCDDYQGETEQTISYGEEATSPTNLVKEGYTFKGWDNAFDYITGNIIITANWEITVYQLTLDGGERYRYFKTGDDTQHQTIEIEVTVNHQDKIPLPETIPPTGLKHMFFTGYMNEDGEMITDYIGNLTKPYQFERDQTFTAQYMFLENQESYQELLIFPDKLVTSEELITELSTYISENESINSENFYYNFKYYTLLDSELIDETFKANNPFDYYFFEHDYVGCTYWHVTIRFSTSSPLRGKFTTNKVVGYGSVNTPNAIGFSDLPLQKRSGLYSFSQPIASFYHYTSEIDSTQCTEYAKALGYQSGEGFLVYDSTTSGPYCWIDTETHPVFSDKDTKIGIKLEFEFHAATTSR